MPAHIAQETQTFLLAQELTRTPPRGTPTTYVVAKWAQSLDGRLATRNGDSKWISCAEERLLTHAMRSDVDAVVVGVRTVLADDPQLTVRSVTGRPSARVVLDSQLRIPESARVLRGDATTVVVTTDRSAADKRERLAGQGVRICVVDGDASGVSLPAAKQALTNMGICSLLVEGGGTVITSFLSSGLVDRLVVSLSPLLIGTGVDAVGDLGTDSIGEALRLRDVTMAQIGTDVMISGRPVLLAEEPDLRSRASAAGKNPPVASGSAVPTLCDHAL